MAKMRARRISGSRWVTRSGSRPSGIARASRSAMPSRRSAWASNMTPPSELIRPPSKAAVIFLRRTAGKQNGRRLSSVMAGVRASIPAKGWLQQPNPTPDQQLTLLPPPLIRPRHEYDRLDADEWRPRNAEEEPRLVANRSGALREVPVEDLLAGPEQDAGVLLDMGERAAEIFEAVRRAHDVGVHDQGHDPGRVARIGVELVELVAGAVAILARLVMLDQHHRDIVAFLRIGEIDDRLGARRQHHRLVVEHPVADIIVALLGEEV